MIQTDIVTRIRAGQDCAGSFPDHLEVVKCGLGVSLEPRKP